MTSPRAEPPGGPAPGRGPLAPLSFGLVLFRYLAPTVVAILALLGVDTKGFDQAWALYVAVLPALLFAVLVRVLVSFRCGPGPGRRWGAPVALMLAVAVQWLGFLDPALRLVPGPLADGLLDATVAAAIVAHSLGLARVLVEGQVAAQAQRGFRAMALGYSLAYAIQALRPVAGSMAARGALPVAVGWWLDHGPLLLLCALASATWYSNRPAAGGRTRLVVWGPPVVLAATAGLIADSPVGFVLTNALAWGGAYAPFHPTSVSLALVGFGLGAFVSLAWRLRARMPGPGWRLVVLGVATTACAGVASRGGSLPSLAGIALGLTWVARGLVGGLAPAQRR